MKPIISPFMNTNISPTNKSAINKMTPSDAHQRFSSLLKNAINEVNQAQQISDQKTNALVRGEIDDLHDVMIAAQKANITLQTATQIQSKAMEAYREVMRMQI
ncbi:flagellar hook-basal body complex protein FliE [Bacillaceae bacterium W0354]